MAQVREAVVAPEEVALRPAPPVDLRRAARLGLIGGVAMVLTAATGIVGSFEDQIVIEPFLPLGLLFLYLVPFAIGWMAGRPPPQLEGFAVSVPGRRNVIAGSLAGVLAGLCTGALMVLLDVADLRGVFIELSPRLYDILTFGLPLAVAIPLVAGISAASGAIGGVVRVLPVRLRHSLMPALMWVLIFSLTRDVVAQVFTGIKVPSMITVIFTRRGGPLTILGAIIVFVAFFALYWVRAGRRTTLRQRYEAMERPQQVRWTVIAALAVGVVLVLTPQIVGPFVSQVLDNVGVFLLMALGLNIVVGYAGLLDLGYVAFFAVGAYSTAVLTSPLSPAWAPSLNFWAALPFVMIFAVIAGIIVATPVVRMRGDYLAIVTLAFGEIARILLNSEWLAPYFGGAQGITNIPNVSLGPVLFRTPQAYVYLFVAFALVATYITYSLQKSRWGRAWMAMREDESVAEAMGVNIVTAKLSAFIMGAVLASFGGALFATQIGSVFPHSFDIVVSITVLVVIIVGGMGSVPGVAVGALVLIGLPNLLREFSEYQFLFYGLLLIAMMLNKPEGFIPSRRRAQELHHEEAQQDAWMEMYGTPDTVGEAPGQA